MNDGAINQESEALSKNNDEGQRFGYPAMYGSHWEIQIQYNIAATLSQYLYLSFSLTLRSSSFFLFTLCAIFLSCS